MGLTSRGLELLALAASLLAPLALLLLWNRLRGHKVVQVMQRVSLIGLAQASAVLLVFLAVNNQYVFYASWNDLLGAAPPAPPIVSTTTTTTTAHGSRLLDIRDFKGPTSHVRAQVLVRLPPQYDQPAYATHRFPVVLFLTGWRGYPTAWERGLSALTDLDRLEASRQVQSFIAVIPSVNIALPRDTECTDVPNGPKAESWLAQDVPTLVRSRFRALTDPRSWGTIGYSTGGYCAAKLSLLHPQTFGPAVVISGYFGALRDSDTGDLWGGSAAVRRRNDLIWVATHKVLPATDLLAFTTKQDQDSYPSTLTFLRVAGPPLRTYSQIADEGGHNLKVMRKALPSMLVWLSSHLKP
jgi:S-formylglutathione hydrolase FrmB